MMFLSELSATFCQKRIVISSKNILVLREPGHRHGWVVSDQLKQRGAEPHEHVVHLGRKVKN